MQTRKLIDPNYCNIMWEYETATEEIRGISLQVDELLKQGLSASKISIICKELYYQREIKEQLQLLKIPVNSTNAINLYEVPLAQKLIYILQYLACEYDTNNGAGEMLFRILHFDFFSVPSNEITKLTVVAAENRFASRNISFRALLRDKATLPPKDLFDTGLNERLKSTIVALEELIAHVGKVSPGKLFETLISHCDVIQFIKSQSNQAELFQVVDSVKQFINGEMERNPDLSVQGLVDKFHLMQKKGVPLLLLDKIEFTEGVNLQSTCDLQRCKPDYVFIVCANTFLTQEEINLYKEYFRSKDLSFINHYSKNETFFSLIDFVVNSTCKQLVISYSKHVVENHFLNKSKYPTLKVQQTENDFVKKKLDSFVMNVSALNNFLLCPLHFYFNNILCVPAGKSEAATFGSAVHFALQRLFEKMQANGNRFQNKQTVVEDFTWYMHQNKERFTNEQFERRLAYGKDILNRYYDEYIHRWRKVVAVERNINNVILDGVPIKGKIDKLEFDGKNVNVVDYKTGDYERALPGLQPPNESMPHGGNYWRQAVFYKVLVDNYSGKQWTAISSEIDFIEPDQNGFYHKVKIMITAADIATVKNQLTTVWDKIHARDFYTGCGKPYCTWCNFVSSNNSMQA